MRYQLTIVLALTAALSAATAGADDRQQDRLRLAVTFDDLPWVGAPPVDGTISEAINRIAAVLNVHGVPATGFVICENAGKVKSAVDTWASWGQAMGNHSSTHMDLNLQSHGTWLEDVARCDKYLRDSYPEVYKGQFRFPLLHQGDSAAKKQAVRNGLDSLDLTTAHVSVDTSDWILAQAHARAIEVGDDKLRRDIGKDFIRHVLAAIDHADTVARRKVDRRISQVLLLHFNALVDDYLDELLLAMRGRHIEFVSLDEALSDSVYQRKDEYIGSKGLSWLYRMHPVSVEDGEWDDREATLIRSRYSTLLERPADIGRATNVTEVAIAPSLEDRIRPIFEAAAESERLRSLLISQRDRLIGEAYFNGAGRETPANLKSVTKSVTAVLTGIAIGNGWIENINDPVGKYLPEIQTDAPLHAAATIRQLLTMSSGIEPVDYGVIQQSASWVQRIIHSPVDPDAIGKFNYDTPVLQLLTATIARTSGRKSLKVANEMLGSLNAKIEFWRHDPDGTAFAGNDAYMTPRAMLAFGELLLNHGCKHNKCILPEWFVAEMTTPRIEPPDDWINHRTLRVRGYGYLFWLTSISDTPVAAALGHGGQMILLVPEYDAVVVVTSRWPGPSSALHYAHVTHLLEERLFPLLGSLHANGIDHIPATR